MDAGLNFCEKNISWFDNILYKVGEKGRQHKWCINGMWYKVDGQIGCEGLAETIVSDMLKKSNIARYFTYEPIRINVGKQSYKGCVSPNGLADGEQLITAYDILKRSKSPFFRRIEDAFDYGTPKEYLTEFISEMERLTNIENFGEYIKAILELDAITLNDDRHMNNICVVRNGKEFSVGPVFDNGHAFLLWRRKNIHAMEPLKAVTVEAMPFSHSFETQRRIAQELYGGMFLKINYGAKDLKETLRRCETCYNEKDLEFAEKVCRTQMNLNIDYFFNNERAEWI
ncbi:MAG: hypothetical protein J6D36_09915, partial [Erysipelotrichaceae bacterium]|nr:hypothetical protein [Erysipelotrichaceae bacterium]